MYFYELHCHERLASACGRWSPKEMVEFYARQGYTGIVVSDHFMNGNSAVDRSLPWTRQVEQFCAGYEQATAEGEKLGLDVFFAFEYSANSFYGVDLTPLGREAADRIRGKDTVLGCDFLIYGLGKEWLLSKDADILTLGVNEFMELVRDAGGTVIQAHPYRLEKAYMDHISLFPDFTDGVEVLNANPNTRGRPNRLARAYAEEFGFFQTAGSDSHDVCDHLAVTKLQCRVSSMEELIRELRAGRAELALIPTV